MAAEDEDAADFTEHFPVAIDRDYEERLVELCALDSLDANRWAAFGARLAL